MSVQIRPDELVDILTPDFQARAEPNFSWRAAVSCLMTLPLLRGAWPMSAIREIASSRVRDYAEQNNNFNEIGSPLYGYDNLVPYVEFDGAADYLNQNDAGAGDWADITGTETFVVAAQRGLTFGGWFYPMTTTVAATIYGKWGAAGQRSYRLVYTAADAFQAEISDDGTNSDTATSAVSAINNWYCVVARFDPSTTVDVFVNGTWVTAATARASVFDSTSSINIGARSGGNELWNGRASLCFLSSCYISNALVSTFYQQTRVMYGR